MIFRLYAYVVDTWHSLQAFLEPEIAENEHEIKPWKPVLDRPKAFHATPKNGSNSSEVVTALVT